MIRVYRCRSSEPGASHYSTTMRSSLSLSRDCSRNQSAGANRGPEGQAECSVEICSRLLLSAVVAGGGC